MKIDQINSKYKVKKVGNCYVGQCIVCHDMKKSVYTHIQMVHKWICPKCDEQHKGFPNFYLHVEECQNNENNENSDIKNDEKSNKNNPKLLTFNRLKNKLKLIKTQLKTVKIPKSIPAYSKIHISSPEKSEPKDENESDEGEEMSPNSHQLSISLQESSKKKRTIFSGVCPFCHKFKDHLWHHFNRTHQWNCDKCHLEFRGVNNMIEHAKECLNSEENENDEIEEGFEDEENYNPDINDSKYLNELESPNLSANSNNRRRSVISKIEKAKFLKLNEFNYVPYRSGYRGKCLHCDRMQVDLAQHYRRNHKWYCPKCSYYNDNFFYFYEHSKSCENKPETDKRIRTKDNLKMPLLIKKENVNLDVDEIKQEDENEFEDMDTKEEVGDSDSDDCDAEMYPNYYKLYMSEWSVNDVYEFITNTISRTHAEQFKLNNIRGTTLRRVTESQLKEYGLDYEAQQKLFSTLKDVV